jgi:hypothetical protein
MIIARIKKPINKKLTKKKFIKILKKDDFG